MIFFWQIINVEDGLDGARRLHEAGACLVVQDEATSVVWGMPGAVAREGLADAALALDEIATTLARTLARAPVGAR